MIHRKNPSTWLERFIVVICLLTALLLMQLTAWKENEYFWTLSGGYPIWLREAVQILYYPTLLGTLILHFFISRIMLIKLYRKRAMNRCLFILGFSWLLVYGSIMLLLANNVLNFIQGRPIHYHAPILQPYHAPEP